MDEFETLIEDINKKIYALEKGVQQAIIAAPRLAKREMESYVDNKLDVTAENFKDEVDIFYEDGVVMIDFGDKWITGAIEDGADAWDMKTTHLKGNVKISKEGYRYKVIPIQKFPDSRGGGTAKSQYYHGLVKEALKDPTFAGGVASVNMTGQVTVMERLLTDERDLQGFYRIQTFKDKESQNEGRGDTRFVMFRVMSEHPKQADKWLHPGIRPINVHDHLEQYALTKMPTEIDEIALMYLEDLDK